MTHKIAIITCWLGEYPAYFPFWVKSCENNPNIDWILMADKEPNIPLPSNVIFYHTSLQDLQRRAKKELSLDGKGLTSPYKLCDFKAAYGMLFKEELKNYTHWGHCDIDLVWGDFTKFLTEEILGNYDKIYTKGHLGIYKNSEEVNRRCFSGKSLYPFSLVAETPNFYAFDEHTGMERIYKKSGYRYYAEKPYIDVSVRYESSFLLNDFPKNYQKQAFYWEDGKMYRVYVNEEGQIATDEWLYLHFQKKNPAVHVKDVEKAESFWIGPNGFVERAKGSDISEADIVKMNPLLDKKQAKQEKRAYFKKKIKQFMKKSWKDKCIHIKQRVSRIFS